MKSTVFAGLLSALEHEDGRVVRDRGRCRAARERDLRVPVGDQVLLEQYLNDGAVHWHPHLMFYVPGDTNPAAWGANLPSSPVLGGGQDLPGGGRMPWTIFFVPISRWSDGTPADEHPGAHK